MPPVTDVGCSGQLPSQPLSGDGTKEVLLEKVKTILEELNKKAQ